MEQSVQDAIETVDSARQHKCELEGRRSQLQAAISQVETTAEITRKEIQHYFADLQQKIIQDVQMRVKQLTDEVCNIEQQAVDPLKDCLLIIQESIDEAETVVSAGEDLLNQDVDDPSCDKHLKKFISMADSLPLDSLPEVPCMTEVPSISVVFDEGFTQALQSAIKLEGQVNRQSPVQITNLQPRPGAIKVSWGEVDEDAATEIRETGSSLLYKLQSCLGKVSKLTVQERTSKKLTLFQDAYVGPLSEYTVRNLSPNTVYTFRVCRCVYHQDASAQVKVKRWSPWSVYQEKITTLPGIRWARPKDLESFALTEKNKTACKKGGHGKVVYSDVSSCLIGYSVTFKIEAEGRFKSKSDCIALCTKRDPDATAVHTKESTLAILANGYVFINGVKNETKFSGFSRNLCITFKLDDVTYGESQGTAKTKTSKIATFRVSLTVGDKEAVFDWHPFKTIAPCYSQNLAFVLMLSSVGWKVTIL